MRFVSSDIISQISGPLDFIVGTYKTSWYNFEASVEFETNQVAKGVFSKVKDDVPCTQILAHFFSHILVGASLLIPILNFAVFAILFPDEESTITIPTPPLSTPTPTPTPIPTPKPAPEALQKPALDGKRNNPIPLAPIERKVTEDFFRLFPNETCHAPFAGLRRLKGCEPEYYKPLSEDKEYIKQLFLNVPGYTPEVRFINATANLQNFSEFLHERFPKLNREFFLSANYRKDMQKGINEIPYINIIKTLFFYTPDQFLALINTYTYTQLPEISGERIAIQISAPHQQVKEISIPGLVDQRIQAIRSKLQTK